MLRIRKCSLVRFNAFLCCTGGFLPLGRLVRLGRLEAPLSSLEGGRERRKNACSLSPRSGEEKGEGLLPLLYWRLSLPWLPCRPWQLGSLEAWMIGGLEARSFEVQRVRGSDCSLPLAVLVILEMGREERRKKACSLPSVQAKRRVKACFL